MYSRDDISLTLIDGDTYEESNKTRQRFSRLGNKARVTRDYLWDQFPELNLKAVDEYISEENIVYLIRERAIIFLCVDNHATRKLVSDRCQELDNITLISGGNDYLDGNVIYYHKFEGKDVTKPLTELYPEIQNPKDSIPGAKKSEGCGEQAKSEPQLIFTNFAAASHMCNVFYAHEENQMNFEQVYFDIGTHRARPAPERY